MEETLWWVSVSLCWVTQRRCRSSRTLSEERHWCFLFQLQFSSQEPHFLKLLFCPKRVKMSFVFFIETLNTMWRRRVQNIYEGVFRFNRNCRHKEKQKWKVNKGTERHKVTSTHTFIHLAPLTQRFMTSAPLTTTSSCSYCDEPHAGTSHVLHVWSEPLRWDTVMLPLIVSHPDESDHLRLSENSNSEGPQRWVRGGEWVRTVAGSRKTFLNVA